MIYIVPCLTKPLCNHLGNTVYISIVFLGKTCCTTACVRAGFRLLKSFPAVTQWLSSEVRRPLFPICNHIKHRVSRDISSNGEECAGLSVRPPPHCLNFWMPCVFLIVSCKLNPLVFLWEKDKDWSEQALGFLLLQTQMFIH